jgi:hypothetical protein
MVSINLNVKHLFKEMGLRFFQNIFQNIFVDRNDGQIYSLNKLGGLNKQKTREIQKRERWSKKRSSLCEVTDPLEWLWNLSTK